MTEAKWIILASGRTHGVTAWSDAVRATGRTARVIAHLPLEADEAFGDGECVVANGVATDIARLASVRPWPALAIGNGDAFACDAFLKAWGWAALQQEHRILPIGDVTRDRERLVAELGAAGSLFVRPVGHDKAFDGGLYDVPTLAAWHSQLSLGIGDATRPCLVARPRTIDAEWRLFVSKGHVVAGSSYLVGGRLDRSVPPAVDVVGLAESLARAPFAPLPAVYAIDVCLAEGRPWLVEVGSALSSAPYAADLGPIVEAVSDAAVALCDAAAGR